MSASIDPNTMDANDPTCCTPVIPLPLSEREGKPALLLNRTERLILGSRLTVALAALCLVLIAGGIWLFLPAERGISDLVAGAGAALVAIPVFVEAWQSLRHPSLHGITDRLVALALIAAWATGDLMTAAFLPIIMTLGHVLEERSMLGSHEAVRALTRLTAADSRRLLPDGRTEMVANSQLQVGDLIELRAGERVPADGTVERGTSSLDMASLTGESVPVEVGEGGHAIAGAMNIDGLLQVRLTRVGAQSTLGRIIALMRDAEFAKPPVTRLLDKYAGQYMTLVLLVAGGVWLLTGNTPAMLAVLVASCPCALVLAAPSTAVAAIAVAARHGILIKGSAFLEHLADVSSVIFDKTGTLTTGQLRVAGVRPVADVDADLLRRIGGSLGAGSNHPLSRAAAAAVPAGERLQLQDTRELGGFGVTGQLDGQQVALGRADLFTRLGVDAPAPPAHNGPIAGVSRNGQFLGWLLFYDQLRGSAAEAVRDLKGLGIEHMVLLTGDRVAVAQQVADEIHIDEVCAEMLPEQKMDRVMQEIKAGRRPMVVGDGINDSLALRAGAVGVAMGTQGADVALASADLALMTNDLRRLGTCIRLSRRCRHTIYVNVAIGLGFTFGLTVLAAAGVLGVEAPIIAALLHNLATFIGLGNAGRLLLFDETQVGAAQPLAAQAGAVPAASAAAAGSAQSLAHSAAA
ncbi:MAG TPA: cation-translocating P-type ATPase [Steroidobacteraceae bacterium]|jgi:heavy metal translocating P-type ATPase|nr:cation-translocating P-type ATPase [Steroidobacteraceae bacterium]